MIDVRRIDPNRIDRQAPAKWHLPRFGMCALLIIILGYCVLLALLGMRWRWHETQQQILASLESFGPGTVISGGNVVVLSLQSTEIRDDDLVHVGRLSSLEQLDLQYTKITDRGVQHLTGLSELRYLSIGGTLITDDAMQSISKLTNLEDLLLGGTARR